jgi:putative flippase GtrA
MLTGQFFRFAIAGVFGFCTDASVLYLVNMLGTGLYLGRLISFLCAVFITWQFNRRITFLQDRPQSIWIEWWRYLSAMTLGGVINLVVYAATIHFSPETRWTPLCGVALGSSIAMFVNFSTSKWWVFTRKR